MSPFAPKKSDIDIRDIAHALSLLCRANGHFCHFYSVAQHSLRCAREAKARGYSPLLQLACLLHDGSEAYLSDLTRPVKQQLALYRETEQRLQNLIYDAFLSRPLSPEELDRLSDVDDALLYREMQAMLEEMVFLQPPTLVSNPTFGVEPFDKVEGEFLDCFHRLKQQVQD